MNNASIKELLRTLIMMIGTLFHYNNNSKVLYYHDVHDINRYSKMSTPMNVFKQHIEQINKSKFEIVKHINKKEKQVQIAFDDGFRGLWDNKEYFIEHKLFPTIFIAVSSIGKDGYLKKNEIITLFRLGFNIQSHSFSHVNLTICKNKELIHEILDSKLYLEDCLDSSIKEVCVPMGFISESVYRECLKFGYTKIYSSIPGDFYDRLKKYDSLIYRNIIQSFTPFQIHLALKGGQRVFQSHYKKMHFKIENR